MVIARWEISRGKGGSVLAFLNLILFLKGGGGGKKGGKRGGEGEGRKEEKKVGRKDRSSLDILWA